MKKILDKLTYWKLLWRKFCNNGELKYMDWMELKRLEDKFED